MRGKQWRWAWGVLVAVLFGVPLGGQMPASWRAWWEQQREALRTGAASLEPSKVQHIFVGERGPDFFFKTRQLTRREVNLTQNPADDLHPAWSPDGSTIAFASNRDGSYDIWLMNTDGSNLRKLTTDPANELYPAWNASGNRIAFVSNRTGQNEIFYIDVVTGRESQVTRNVGTPRHPTWDPGGGRIAFENVGPGGTKIWVINIDGSGARPLTGGPSIDTAPEWSRDGRFIVFSSNGRDANGDGQIDGIVATPHIWVMNPDGTGQTQVTFGNAIDRDPAWLVDPRTGSVSERIIFSSNRDGSFDLFVVNRDGSGLANVSPPGNRTADVEPSPDPNQLEFPRTAFTSKRQENNDIWVLTIEDINPPVLSDGRVAILPKVTPQQALPGSQVKVEAAVFDGESGVEEVWALFKLPDQPIFQWVTYGEGSIQGDTQGRVTYPREFDYTVINANDYSLQDPTLDPFSLDFVRTHGLRLFDDGPSGGHGDRVAGDGIYTGLWRTPATPQDYYVDIVPVDKVGNYPLGFVIGDGAILGFNDILIARGYDHVAGFTTKPFGAGSRVLFVSDYAAGQKFIAATFFFGADRSRYWPAAIPVESYYLDYPDPIVRHSQGAPVLNSDFGSRVREPALGNSTAGRGMVEPVDVWRILCRGPVPFDVLASYLPVPVEDEFLGKTRFHADKMVVWASPYTGDLWVGPGTLLDIETQANLTRFYNLGGRLAVTGQDIAWALTMDGTRPNSFLQNVLHVRYVSDHAVDVITVPASPGLRHEVQGGGPLGPNEIWMAEPISRETWFWHWRLGLGGGNVIDVYPDDLELPGYLPGNASDWTGDAAPNQWFIDDIQSDGLSLVSFTYNSGGQVAGVRYQDPTTGARVVYFAFGLEGVDNEFEQQSISVGGQSVTVVLSRNHRFKLMSNIANYLRTGSIRGRVTHADGQTPAVGVLVKAQFNNNIADRTVAGTTRTLSDGTFEIKGLDSALYRIDATLAGFTADKFPRVGVDGGQVTSGVDIRLLELQPGGISGRVLQMDGVTPVGGATVTATLEGAGPSAFNLSTTSAPDGSYSVSGLPEGTYTVVAQKPGFSSATVPGVAVTQGNITTGIDLLLAPGPGSLSGRVTNAQNNLPILGAKVSVTSGGREIASATTDANGQYRIEQVPAGTYTVLATATGFATGRQTGVVVRTDEETKNVNFALNPLPPGSLSGTITNAANNRPLGDAVVEVLADGAVVASVVSTAQVQTLGGITFNYRFEAIPAGTYSVRVRASGFEEQTRTGVTIRSGQETSNVNFVLSPLHVFVSGLSMVSAPFDYTTVVPDIGPLLDDDDNPATPLRMATWDPAAGRYLFYPDPAARTFALGRGYWLKLARSVALTREGVGAAPNVPFAIPLKAGWNLIGHPFPFSVDWFQVQVRVGPQTMTLAEALSSGLLNNALFTYAFGAYRMVFQLDPFAGYWVRAFRDCELLIPPNPIRQGASRTAPWGEPEWTLTLQAEVGGRADSITVGMHPAASGGFDPLWDQAAPPPAPEEGFLRLSIPHPEWGPYADAYRTDIRRSVPAGATWAFLLETDASQEEVILRWENVRQVPGEWELTLVDEGTGAKIPLRSQPSYRILTGAGGARRSLRLVVAPRTRQRLTIRDFQVLPLRGGGWQVEYDLPQQGQVTLTLRGLNGRLWRQEALGKQDPGRKRLVWQGRDAQGRPLPAGVYLLELEVETEEHYRARAVRPVPLLR